MLDLDVIPLIPLFVLGNMLPLVFVCTYILRLLAKKYWNEGYQQRTYRHIEAATRICETVITICMIVMTIRYSRGGWPCHLGVCIFMVYENLILVILAVAYFWKELKEYIDEGSEGTSSMANVVICTIIALLSIAYFALFFYISLTPANIYVH